ncbi:MAG: DUF342 domain-containing protein [Candidatus Omnitrophica bacterium]|nr:DUF342 domain-containing protein [Candidatus Omnitrophota bacterium]MCA9415013.1 DUF342 domain-containing protein [Candidatus Omnitrophota bacterium]MCA9423554.1 DUF342 domain-containing protein [Candidatus Omnitrophota bacterium]MCA9429110.1 DUF342 domain-containing protein [Candidatus Omnitrophota bacterium]MCA9435522.1 DUF342 domain-containing protein [Candidatus Omnitrophota bacterium]
MSVPLTKDERFALEARDSNLSLEFRLKELGLFADTEVSVSDVLEAIREAKVKAEIDRDAIAKVIEERSDAWVEIGRGTPPKDPTHGWLEFFVDPFHLSSHAKEDEKGKVDHKELNLFLNVSKGQELVRKHDPIPGEDGSDIFGNPIPCAKPKEAILKTGPGVEVIEEGHLAVASEDGAITRKSDTVSITQMYEVSGDVSYKTGNIEFKGSVSISGNVLAGFNVVADDDVIVGGLVEASEIKAGGNIQVGGGIQGGGKGRLEAGGSIHARFASDVTLVAGEDVIMENHLLTCHVTAGKLVQVNDEHGSISGGEICAKESIQAGFLGSEISAKTILSLGLTPDLVKVIGNSKDELKDLNLRLKDIEQVINRIASLPEFKTMDPKQIENIRVKSVQQKFLLQGRIKHLEEELIRLEEELTVARAGTITALDTAHGGVTIKIPGDILRLDHDLRHTTFFYEKGEIRTRAN